MSNSVVEWLREHPDTVHGDVDAFVARCEREVRRHARADAWVAAKQYVAARQHEWEGSHGAHASEAFVAREVCKQLADELARHEPAPHPGDEEHLVGADVKAAIEHEGWMVMIPWIIELGREEEHRTWKEIVDLTKGRARELIRGHHLSSDTQFDQTKCYGDVAARIAGILAEDYSDHASPQRRPRGAADDSPNA